MPFTVIVKSEALLVPPLLLMTCLMTMSTGGPGKTFVLVMVQEAVCPAVTVTVVQVLPL